MNRIEYLKDQAARAERLAHTVLDALTVQRLMAYATECRQQTENLADRDREVASPLCPAAPMA